MADEELNQDKRKPLPRWLVALVIVVSGGITAAAMSMTGMRGPALAWERANQNVEASWSMQEEPAKNAALVTRPLDPVLPVAGAPGVPTIVSGAMPTHIDRGVCTNCHSVVSQQGLAVPAIYAFSVMTHEYRGVCGNCHEFKLAPPMAGGNLVAGVPAVKAPLNTQPAKQATEGEWQGLEVGLSPKGVVVHAAEGAASRLGMQTGDIVTSLNGVPIRTVADFVRVTDNGALAQGTVIARRDTQRLAFEFGASAPNPVPATTWGTPPAPTPLPPQQTQF